MYGKRVGEMLVGITAGEQRLDLGFGRHRRRALQSRGDDGARRVGVLQDLLQRPAGQQSMTQRAAERIASSKTIQRANRYRRGLDPLVFGLGQHTLGALFHDCEVDTGGK